MELVVSMFTSAVGQVLAVGPSISIVDPVVFALIMFVVCIIIGMVATIAGVGGGVLFTPVMMAFTGIDSRLISATGLLIAMVKGYIIAKPFVGKRLVSMKLLVLLCIPMILFSFVGAETRMLLSMMGKSGEGIVRLSLGLIIAAVAFLMLSMGRRVEWPNPPNKRDMIAEALGLQETYHELSLNKLITYRAYNTYWGILTVMGAGFISGLFGLGAGWILLPILNLVMYLPLKVASATSGVLIGLGDVGGLWVYVTKGFAIPIFTIPCLLGAMFGAEIGSRILLRVKAGIVRYLVVACLLVSSWRLIQVGITLLGWL